MAKKTAPRTNGVSQARSAVQKPSKRLSIKQLLKSRSQVVLDLGGGENPTPNSINMDIRDLPSVDIVHDIEQFPWPLPDNCIDLLTASHVVEHINPARGNFLRWMDEAWRVLKPGGQFLISYPYAGSPGFWQDPTHINGCSEATWMYFDPFHSSHLYLVYRPRPFKIVSNEYHVNGNGEVRLAKLAIKPEFGCLSEQPYHKAR